MANRTVDELLDLVPVLRERTAVSELAGGLTNTNYKVETPSGDYVVRVSAKDGSMLAIDRENEYLNSVAAADRGGRCCESSTTSPTSRCWCSSSSPARPSRPRICAAGTRSR